MSAPVYSTRFQVIAGLGGTGPSITVPLGHTYVVKQLTAYASPVLGQTNVFFEDDDTGAALFRAGFQITLGGWAGFFGSIVFKEGQGFHFQVDNPSGELADVGAFGYDLLNS